MSMERRFALAFLLIEILLVSLFLHLTENGEVLAVAAVAIGGVVLSMSTVFAIVILFDEGW